MSELSERSGVPVASIKFYMRERMLPAGVRINATRADYGEEHVHRLALIRSLTEIAGLPLHRAKRVLEVIDDSETEDGADASVHLVLGRAIDALAGGSGTPIEDAEVRHPRAAAALEWLGAGYARSDARMAAFEQLDAALAAVEAAGLPPSAMRLRCYGEHLMAIARMEIDAMPRGDTAAAVEYAVLGTALYEPVLAAIRRLAHQNLTR